MIIGIIGAMEEEVAGLKELMKDVEVCEIASMSFCRGKLCDKEVVLVRSGIGKVNAAVCTQILIDRYQAGLIINTGIAGSLNAKIDIGDIVVSEDLVHHDMDAVAFGYEEGQIPRMDTLSFPAEETLVAKVRTVNERVNPDIHTFVGRIASGDQFIASDVAKKKIVERFEPLCVEMEGAAIAQTAYLNKVSCVIIRAISDKADNSASVDYPAFERQAIARGIKLVRNLLLEL